MLGHQAAQHEGIQTLHEGRRILGLPAFREQGLIEQDPYKVIKAGTLIGQQGLHQGMIGIELKNRFAIWSLLASLLEQSLQMAAHVMLIGD